MTLDGGPWFALALLVIAGLYAAVGQAGATGYFAAMGLLGLSPEVMKPTALALNLVVATIAALQFHRARQFSLAAFLPFGILGIPISLLGGAIQLPASIYHPAVGILLLVAAGLMLRSAAGPRPAPAVAADRPPFWPAVLAGAVVGLLSGTTGTGGGVFLAPVILALNWLDVRRAAAVSAACNLLNSAAALAGSYAALGTLPPSLPGWILAVAVGGSIGATLGARHLPERSLRTLLGLILLASGVRLILL